MASAAQNHNKASPSTCNRNSIAGRTVAFPSPHTLNTLVHSHLPLSANEHPCFLPAPPFESCLAPTGWVVFSLSLLLYIAPTSICFLLVYQEQLAGGGLHFLTSTCVVLFFTHCCYKSVRSVHSYIIYVVCPLCCAFVSFYTSLKHRCLRHFGVFYKLELNETQGNLSQSEKGQICDRFQMKTKWSSASVLCFL